MKIIGTDNLARESIADYVLLTDITESEMQHARWVVEKLNARLALDEANTYYKIVDDSYELWRGMEEFI